MAKYLRVDIEGCVQGCCSDPVYTPLNYLTKYSERDLLEIGRDVANEQHSWGCQLVDESEVPERER
jgi:hypothetical protein